MKASSHQKGMYNIKFKKKTEKTYLVSIYIFNLNGKGEGEFLPRKSAYLELASKYTLNSNCTNRSLLIANRFHLDYLSVRLKVTSECRKNQQWSQGAEQMVARYCLWYPILSGSIVKVTQYWYLDVVVPVFMTLWSPIAVVPLFTWAM